MYEIIGIVLFTFIKKKNFARIRFNREARFDLYRIFTREFQIAKFYESKAEHSYGINIKRFYILIHHPFQFLIKCTKLQESYFIKKKNPWESDSIEKLGSIYIEFLRGNFKLLNSTNRKRGIRTA